MDYLQIYLIGFVCFLLAFSAHDAARGRGGEEVEVNVICALVWPVIAVVLCGHVIGNFFRKSA